MDNVQLSQPAAEPAAAIQPALGNAGEKAATSGFSQIFIDQKGNQLPKAQLKSEQPAQAGKQSDQSSAGIPAEEIHEVAELDSLEKTAATPGTSLAEDNETEIHSVEELIAQEKGQEVFLKTPATQAVALTESAPAAKKVATNEDIETAEAAAQQGITSLPINDTALQAATPAATGAQAAAPVSVATQQESIDNPLAESNATTPKQVDMAVLNTTPQLNNGASPSNPSSTVARGIDLVAKQLGDGAEGIAPEEAVMAPAKKSVVAQAQSQPAPGPVVIPATTAQTGAEQAPAVTTAQANAAALKEAALAEKQNESPVAAVAAKTKTETKSEAVAKPSQPKDLASLLVSTEQKASPLQIEPLYPRRSGDTPAMPALTAAHHPASSFAANSATANSSLTLTPQTLNIRDRGWENGFSQNIQWMASKDIKSAQIRISPAELGPIQVELTMNKDQLSLQLHAHHAITRDTLEAAIPRLRAELGNSGFQQVNVDVGGQNGANDQQAQQSDGEGSGTSQGFNTEPQESEPANSSASAQEHQAGLSLRLLDTFA
ncbi:MAG: flagellar hook-length control protein FliK [Thiotrichales bacterium]